MRNKFVFFLLEPWWNLIEGLLHWFEKTFGGRIEDEFLPYFVGFDWVVQIEHDHWANLIVEILFSIVVERNYLIYFLDDCLVLHINEESAYFRDELGELADDRNVLGKLENASYFFEGFAEIGAVDALSFTNHTGLEE